MNKILGLTLLLAIVMLVSVSAVDAIHPFMHRGSFQRPYVFNSFGVGSFGATQPINAVVDGYARMGGPFPSMSHYVVGLRKPIATHTNCGFACRTRISSAHYPKAPFQGTFGARVGGRFNSAGTVGKISG